MATSLMCVFRIAILLSFFPCLLGQINNNSTEKVEEAYNFAFSTLLHFTDMFVTCVSSTMPSQHFIGDDIAGFLFHPAKTTVGYAPKFTTNRKFFANLVGTTAFHHMVARDMKQLRQDFVSKLMFCDETVLDQDMLKDMQDRIVEEHKL